MKLLHPAILISALVLLVVIRQPAAAAGITILHPDFGLKGSFSLPNCAALPDGRILCAFVFTDRTKGTTTICTSASSDAGRTWALATRTIECPGPGYIADPNILVKPSGVTVFATFVPRQPNHRLAISHFLASHSSGDLKSWSTPVELHIPHKYKSGKVHVPVWLDQHSVVMGYSWDIPAEIGAPQTGDNAMYSRAGVLISRDDGKTWAPEADIFINAYPIGADEPALVSLGGQDLFMIIRTATRRPYEAFSHDGGRTWTEPRPSRFLGFNSPSALLRLTNNSVLRIWDQSDRHRYPLVASISNDQCRSWTTPRTITAPQVDSAGATSFDCACYPSAAMAPNGEVVVVWQERPPSGSRLGVTTLSSQWLSSLGGSITQRSPKICDMAASWEAHEGIPLPSARSSHAGGMVGMPPVAIIAGGTAWSADRSTKSFLRDSYWFDRGIWRAGPLLPEPMAEGAYAADGASLYLAGGLTAPDVPTNAVCRIVRRENGRFDCEPMPVLPEPLYASGGAIWHHQLYIASGYVRGRQSNQLWVLPLQSGTHEWKKCTPCPGPPRAYPALIPCGNSLYLLGGLAAPGGAGKLNVLRDVWKYDPSNDRWEQRPNLPVAGYCWSGQPLDADHILLAGRADGSIHRDAWLIDFSTDAARHVADSIIQTTCAPLVRAGPGEFWLLGGEPDSNKTRTAIVTVFQAIDP